MAHGVVHKDVDPIIRIYSEPHQVAGVLALGEISLTVSGDAAGRLDLAYQFLAQLPPPARDD